MLPEVSTDRDVETHTLRKALIFMLAAMDEAYKKQPLPLHFRKDLLNCADELDDLEPAKEEPDNASLANAIRRIVAAGQKS